MLSDRAKVVGLSKAPTYIEGLDQILEGGFPRGRTTVIRGSAGCGKTVLGLEFLYRGAMNGEPGIWVGFEEPEEQLRGNAAALGWDLMSLEKQGALFIMAGKVGVDVMLSGEFSLKGLLAAISGKARELDAKRVVMDALEVPLRLFEEPAKVRSELHMLNDWLREKGLTTVMTIRPSAINTAGYLQDFFDSMADCMVQLESRAKDNITTSRLRVIKYRGSNFGKSEYPYVISKGGLFLAPMTSVGLRHKPLGDKMPTGVEELDRMLDGGYRRAGCILIAGEPGTGKTTLACSFLLSACQRNEKALFISFEESNYAILENMKSAGIDLSPYVESGALTFMTRFPEAMGPEEHYLSALRQIQTILPRHVIVDAISACERMGGRQASFDYLMRLLNLCKEMGITIFLINQTAGRLDQLEISGNGISSMVDTAIFLGYHEEPGETNRSMRVLKARGSAHSNQMREFTITERGISMVDPYLGRGRVLTGTQRQLQEEEDRIESERLEFEIREKELELQRMRSLKNTLRKGSEERALLRRGRAAPKEVV